MKADEDELRKHQARALSPALDDLSKKWWWSGIACKLGVFFVGTVIVLWSPGLKYDALLIYLIYLTSELCLLRSDAIKGLAETILRQLEFEESFDRKIKGAEMSDYVMRSPARLRKSPPTSAPEENYFASSEVSAPVRAVENVQESSWWNKHMAERMGHLCLTATSCDWLRDRARHARHARRSKTHQLQLRLRRAVTLAFCGDMFPDFEKSRGDGLTCQPGQLSRISSRQFERKEA